MNRILLFGGSGILGSEVMRQLQAEDMVYSAPPSSKLDVRNRKLLENFVLEYNPNWIVNCAAWTNVDGAEELFESAIDLNERAVRSMAEIARPIGCKVVHVSTDYVFDGESSIPYVETSPTNPINKYGESKLRGEKVLLEILPTEAYVVRTAWLYGITGRNFVKTIATMALSNQPAQVVNDQLGCPTSSRDLAIAIIEIIKNSPPAGIYNFSNNGSCSWFELARMIYEEVGANPDSVEAISYASLNLKVKRPKYTLLTKEKWEFTGLTKIPEWKISLRSLLPEILRNIQLSEIS